MQPSSQVEVAIVGAGFSGLGMAIALKRLGVESMVVLEKSAGLGGTWRDNHYPGCACDIPSHLYSFSFERNPGWTRHFAPQPEILSYLEGCARKHALAPHLQFGIALEGARWLEGEGVWQLSLSGGRTLRARVLVSAVGGLSRPRVPQLEGLEKFKGKVFHSQQWDEGYELRGKKVAVVGTGASAIQFVPQIAPLVERLDLYQRTPPWVMPKPDREIGRFARGLLRALPFLQWLVRGALYALFEWRGVAFVRRRPMLMRWAKNMALTHLHAQVADPALRAALTPDYEVGCKRVLISNDYYPALMRPNVRLVTQGVASVTADGVVDAQGVERKVDAIIFGTGFDALNPMGPVELVGRGGISLQARWRQSGPHAYLGTAVPGFPNFFMVVGPNTGLGHNSMIYMIESQVAYITRAVRALRAGLKSIEVKAEVESRFNDSLQSALQGSIWASGCKSWYLDGQGRNIALWPGFTFQFRRRTRRFKLGDYQVEP